jgi:hypothetical protein
MLIRLRVIEKKYMIQYVSIFKEMINMRRNKVMKIVAILFSVLVVMSQTVFAKSGGVNDEIDALKSTVTSLTYTVSNLVSDFSSLKIQQQTNTKDIANLKQTVSTQANQLQLDANEIASLKQTISALGSQEQTDASDIVSLKQAISALGSKEQTDENDIKNLKQSIATQTSQITSLQQTVNSQAVIIAQLLNHAVKINLLGNFPSDGKLTYKPNVWAYDAYFQVVNGLGQPINIDQSALNGMTLTVNGQTYHNSGSSPSASLGWFYISSDGDPGTQPNEYQIAFYTNTSSLSNVSAVIGSIPDIGTFTTPAF